MAARKLPISLVPGPREAPLDYVSRLAFRNGRDSVRAICSDFGIRYRDVASGHPGALAEVEILGSVGAGTLARNAFVPLGERMRVLHKGEVLHRSMLSRYRIRICPACTADDVAGGQGRIEARPWRRSEWLLRDVRACRDHGIELVDIGQQTDPKVPDFSRGLSMAIAELGLLQGSAVRRPTSGFEDYILGRLESQARHRVELLDRLPLYACIRLSEVLGAVALDGRDAEMTGIPEATLQARQSAGFDIAAPGVASIRRLLDRLRDEHGRRPGHSGPQAFFGRLYLWLAHQSRDPAYEPIRDVVREHCLVSIALAPEGAVAPFGERPGKRLVHSVRSAAIEYGLNPVSLRKVLTAKGVVGPNHESKSDDMLTFDAAEHAELLSDLTSSLELKDAAAYLGMPASHAELFVREGLLQPWLGERDGMRKRRFRKVELDDFLGGLSRNVDPFLADNVDLRPLPRAARAARLTLVSVVRLLAGDKLKRVASSSEVATYATILVDPAEIRALSDERPSIAMTVSEASAKTGLPPHVIRNLMRFGLLPAAPCSDVPGRSLPARITASGMGMFRERYVSLKELADREGVTPRLLWNRLAAAGALPVSDHRKLGAAIYRRSDLPDVAKLDLVPWPAGKRRE